MTTFAPALDRVRRIPSWSPEREPRVLWLRTSDELGFTLAVAFACLGVERILLQVESRSSRPHIEETRIQRFLGRWLQRVEFELMMPRLDPLALELMLESREVDVVVDGIGGRLFPEAAANLGIPYYAVFASGTQLAFGDAPLADEPFVAPPPQLETAFAAAGLVSHDYAWRHVLDPAPPMPDPCFRFDLGRPFASSGSPLRSLGTAPPEPLRVLMLGAGGLSCPAGLCLSRRLAPGSRVVVCDFDHVDATNSRQFLFRTRDIETGCPKVRAFCREMERIAPQIAWLPVQRALPHPEIAAMGPYDVSLAFSDNLASRAELDRANLAPLLVHAAVDIESATAGVFHSDSLRLSQALDLENAALHEQGRASCAEADPSIVSTNFLGAALALAQLWSHYEHGRAPTRLDTYEIGSSSRGGRLPLFPTAAAATAPEAVVASERS